MYVFKDFFLISLYGVIERNLIWVWWFDLNRISHFTIFHKDISFMFVKIIPNVLKMLQKSQTKMAEQNQFW